jgi:hypothetical protein
MSAMLQETQPHPTRLAFITKPLLADYIQVALHLPEVEKRNWVALFEGGAFDPDECAIRCAAMAGPKWALIHPQGHALAVGGLFGLQKGVWQEWLLATGECWQKHAFTATRHCKKIMDLMFETGEAHRIQCVSLAEKTKAHEWYRILGFRFEGTLRHYGVNREDCMMFARTNEDET